MKTHSFIKFTLFLLLLVGADSGTRTLAQDADAPVISRSMITLH